MPCGGATWAGSGILWVRTGRWRAFAAISRCSVRARPADQREVRLSYDVEDAEFILRVQGRLDGLLSTPEGMLLEEIKTVQGNWDGAADPLHWAQAKCYGFMCARSRGLGQLGVRLVYVDLASGAATEFAGQWTQGELAEFFDGATAIYLEWVRERRHWCRQRDQSIVAHRFPFGLYRPGQRKAAVAAYRAVAGGGRLFLEAPTGIGKTIAVLFPAVKALGQGKVERIFYLTARTVGRAVAEKAFGELRRAGARLRTLTITAREKICAQDGQPCDPACCPFARGYYDRLKPAMRAALERAEITRPVLEQVSLQHQVCPFQLALDLSEWVDAVICDYNYVFDPQVYLRRHFGEQGGAYAFLVDEAHNLVDRGREMFSADLTAREIQQTRRAIQQALPRCARALSRLSAALRRLGQAPCLPSEPAEEDGPDPELGLFRTAEPPQGKQAATATATAMAVDAGVDSRHAGSAARTPSSARLFQRGPRHADEGVRAPFSNRSRIDTASGGEPRPGLVSRELPEGLLPLVETALAQAEAWLAGNQPADFRQSLLELYFRLHSFQRTASLYDEHFVTICEPGADARTRLFCLDPSALLRQALARGKAAVFFSATLTPLDYYRQLLGGAPDDPALQLDSPFPQQNLAVLVQDRIRTQFKARAQTLLDVAQALRAATAVRAGNYLAYFPSYHYLGAVQEAFRALHPEVRLLAQRPGMSEAQREAFLAAFAAEHTETLVGFAVMGGVFGEGIDLVGERLIGAIIVGVGLPQLCAERDLIRDYFQAKTGSGFEYAYTFPGMNRVLQATGRVIRSETDRGVVLLIDTRFGEPRYRRLFPKWWRPARVRHTSQIAETVRRFWEGRGPNAECGVRSVECSGGNVGPGLRCGE